MANQQNRGLDIDTMVPVAAFQDLAAISPILHGLPPADWEENQFGLIQMWSGAALEDDQISNVGRVWMASVLSNTISMQTAVQGLRLAMSLKSMNNENPRTIISQHPRGAVPAENTLAMVPIPATATFPNTPFIIRTQQTIPGAIQAVQPIATQVVAAPVQAQPLAAAETMKQMRQAYCFLAAYLMKLLVKDAGNAVEGLINMKQRYESFYGPSATIRQFNITLPHALTYKKAILHHAMIGLTYTHALAHTQNTQQDILGQRELGMLCYLGFFPFAYTGFQVYFLLLQIYDTSKLAFNKLLSLFYANVTAPALGTIADIVRTHERTVSHPNRPVSFRYCALWAPHYFSQIRSKNCPHLLWVVISTWKTLHTAGVRADPARIIAVSTLSPTMKASLRRAGEIIGDALKGGRQASQAYGLAFAAAAPTEADEDDENIDWSE